MLGGYDEPRKASVLDGLDIIIGVKVLRKRENLARCLIAVVFAPLNLVERVGTKVAKRREFVLLIFVLRAAGNNSILLWRISGKRGCGRRSKRPCRCKEQCSRQQRSDSRPP